MNISLSDLIKKYPFTLESIANHIGVSKQWINQIMDFKTIRRKELVRKHFLTIQDMLQQSAEKMYMLRINYENFRTEIPNFPFGLKQLSLSMNKPRDFIETLIQLPDDQVSISDIEAIQQKINNLGFELYQVHITDYDEHDEVARYLLSH